MKRLFTLFTLMVCLLCSLETYAQNQTIDFDLQEDGTFLTPLKKDYVVINFPNIPKKELYEKVLLSISTKFISPKDVLSTVPYEMISMDGYEETFLGSNITKKERILLSANYTLKFHFKDGRIKVDAPYVYAIGPYKVNFHDWLSGLRVFEHARSTKDKMNYKLTIQECNQYFDKLIPQILTFDSEEDDW